jgi:hypothetical protein
MRQDQNGPLPRLGGPLPHATWRQAHGIIGLTFSPSLWKARFLLPHVRSPIDLPERP